MPNRDKSAIPDLEVEVLYSLQPHTHHGFLRLEKTQEAVESNQMVYGSLDADQESNKLQKGRFKKRSKQRVTYGSAGFQMGDVEDLKKTPVSRHAQVDLPIEQEELETVNIVFVSSDCGAFKIRTAHTEKRKTVFENTHL